MSVSRTVSYILQLVSELRAYVTENDQRSFSLNASVETWNLYSTISASIQCRS